MTTTFLCARVLKICTLLAGGVCALFFYGCASATGMNMRLDYASAQAEAQTQARIEHELSPEQQWSFYQSLAVLSMKEVMLAGTQSVNAFAAALRAGNIPSSSFGQIDNDRSDTSLLSGDTRAFLQSRFGGKTPRWIIERAKDEGALQESTLPGVMNFFFEQAKRLPQN